MSIHDTTNGTEGRRAGAFLRIAATCLAALLASSDRGAFAESIHLKDKRVVTGVVDENASTDTHLAVRTTSGVVRIPRSKIARIETRDDMTAEEKAGDLAAHDGDLDKALALYEKAAKIAPPGDELKKKLADVEETIRKRDDEKYGRQFEQIEALIAARKYEEAVALAGELEVKVPGASAKERCRAMIAHSYLEQAREFRNIVSYPQAEKAYRRCIDADPEAAIAYLELADLVQGYPARQDEAFPLYETGIRLALADPKLVEEGVLLLHRYNYAKLHFGKSRYRESIPLYWDVVLADPRERFPQSIDQAVKAARAIQSELTEANPANEAVLGILKLVTERKPKEDAAHYLLGKTYYDRKDYAVAIPYLDKAIANTISGTVSKDFVEAHYSLGLALRAVNRDRDAIARFETVLEHQPDRYEVYCELGEIHFGLADYAKALTRFQQAIRVDEASYRAYVGAARTLRRIDKLPEAASMYEKLVAIKDDDPDYFYELGEIYARLDRNEKAVATFQRVLELLASRDANQPETRDYLGRTWGHLGLATTRLKRYNEGIEQLDKALEFKPELGMAYDGKGMAYREIDRLGEAEENFKKALEIEPRNQAFILNLGTFYHNYKKDPKTALTYYMRYYEMGGSDPNVGKWIVECGGTPPEPPA